MKPWYRARNESPILSGDIPFQPIIDPTHSTENVGFEEKEAQNTCLLGGGFDQSSRDTITTGTVASLPVKQTRTTEVHGAIPLVGDGEWISPASKGTKGCEPIIKKGMFGLTPLPPTQSTPLLSFQFRCYLLFLMLEIFQLGKLVARRIHGGRHRQPRSTAETVKLQGTGLCGESHCHAALANLGFPALLAACRSRLHARLCIISHWILKWWQLCIPLSGHCFRRIYMILSVVTIPEE